MSDIIQDGADQGIDGADREVRLLVIPSYARPLPGHIVMFLYSTANTKEARAAGELLTALPLIVTSVSSMNQENPDESPELEDLVSGWVFPDPSSGTAINPVNNRRRPLEGAGGPLGHQRWITQAEYEFVVARSSLQLHGIPFEVITEEEHAELLAQEYADAAETEDEDIDEDSDSDDTVNLLEESSDEYDYSDELPRKQQEETPQEETPQEETPQEETPQEETPQEETPQEEDNLEAVVDIPETLSSAVKSQLTPST